MVFVLVISGLLILVLGIVVLLDLIDSEERDYIPRAILFIIAGLILLAIGTGIKLQYKDFILAERIFLEPIEGEQYVLKDQDTYIFKEAIPNNGGEIRTVTSSDTVSVKTETVEERKMPYMVSYKKLGWVMWEYEYVFYIPE